MKSHYQHFKERRDKFFDAMKLEYSQFVESARLDKKDLAHNNFHNVLHKKSMELQTKLGQRQRIFIEIEDIYELDKTVLRSELFNQKIDELPEDERANQIELLAEYSATSQMFNYWGLQKSKDTSFIELLILVQPELRRYFELMLDQKKINLNTKMETRVNRKEQSEFLTEEIIKVRDNLENDFLNGTYNMLTQPLGKFEDITKDFSKGIVHSAQTFAGGTPFQSEQFNTFIGKLLVEKVDFKENELIAFFNELEKIGLKSDALTTVSQSRNPLQAIIYMLFYFHYEKQYLSHLLKKSRELEKSEAGDKVIDLEKFEWLGNQKQLAELFLELERKGWIENKKIPLIKAYFTNSNTIDQVLKPIQDKRSKENLYSGIYTKAYKPSFDAIKPNKPLKK